MAAFTDEERGRVRYHLGYPDAQQQASLAAGALGVLAISQLVDKQLELLNQTGKARVMELLAQLDSIEAEQRKLPAITKAESMGNMKLRANADVLLLRQYDTWIRKLETAISCERNPQDPRRLWGAGGVSGTWSR